MVRSMPTFGRWAELAEEFLEGPDPIERVKLPKTAEIRKEKVDIINSAAFSKSCKSDLRPISLTLARITTIRNGIAIWHVT